MQEDTIKQEDLDLKDINTVIKHEDAEIKKAGKLPLSQSSTAVQGDLPIFQVAYRPKNSSSSSSVSQSGGTLGFGQVAVVNDDEDHMEVTQD